jgi:hypothetical protein
MRVFNDLHHRPIESADEPKSYKPDKDGLAVPRKNKDETSTRICIIERLVQTTASFEAHVDSTSKMSFSRAIVYSLGIG